MFRHGATYAGHPAACAAALAVLDIYEGEDLIARGRELEGPLADGVNSLADHPAVAEVRAGLGFLAAIGSHPEADAAAPARLVAGAREHGVLARAVLGGVADVSAAHVRAGAHRPARRGRIARRACGRDVAAGAIPTAAVVIS